tara:strand:+ start:78 stop:488 length:411 start_codon:yes stop_codon:yes gene_type:complete
MIEVIENLTRAQEGELRRGGQLLDRREAFMRQQEALKNTRDEDLNVEGLYRNMHAAVSAGAKKLALNERKSNQAAAAQARSMKEDVRFKKQKMMQHKAEIPADEYFAFATSRPGCWEDEEFTRDYLKRNSHLKSNS